MTIVTRGLKAKTISHMCYGDFTTIYPRILDLPVDQLDLEMANSNYDLLDVFKSHRFTKEIGLGVVDVHNHRLESIEEIKPGIRRALQRIPAAKMFVDPDCGLKTRTVEEAKAKLELVVRATHEVKQELGLQ